MPMVLDSIVDLERYPMDSRSSAFRKTLMAHCRAQFLITGAVLLPEFLKKGFIFDIARTVSGSGKMSEGARACHLGSNTRIVRAETSPLLRAAARRRFRRGGGLEAVMFRNSQSRVRRNNPEGRTPFNLDG
ncbi:hypothetical protein [Nocardia sp. NPDC050406]|uniref:hypothetical protein n=1 Tax=Nocardia sp. NPDC050406 TaxID=3364318 RepID=UPI0037A1FD42